MGKFAVIDEHGVVVNRAKADEALAPNWIPFEKGVSLGDRWDGVAFNEPVADADALRAAKAAAIAALADECNADIIRLQVSWQAADIQGGNNSAAKKASIAQDIADRRAKYKSDRLVIINAT